MQSDLISRCELLLKTYNTTILNDFPKKLQTAIKKEAVINCVDKAPKDYKPDSERKVLIQLINNYYDTEKQQKRAELNPKYIGGPKSLTLQGSNKYKKMIYIFGENHTGDSNCYNFTTSDDTNTLDVEEFFEKLFVNTHVFIDFYLETHKQNSTKFVSSPLRLRRLINYFNECIKKETRHAEWCRLFRVHYIDARWVEIEGKPEPLNDLSWILMSIENANNLKKTIEFLKHSTTKNIFNALKSEDDNIFNSFFVSQINNSIYTNTEPKIKEWIEKKMLEIANKYRLKVWKTQIPEEKYIDDAEKDIGTSYEEEMFHGIYIDFINKDFCDGLVETNAIVQDAYCLCRMFKQFNMNEIEKKAYEGATDQPSEAHNIIVYAGDLHSNIYREFLQYLEFENLVEPILNLTKGSKEFCIDAENFHPFFNWP